LVLRPQPHEGHPAHAARLHVGKFALAILRNQKYFLPEQKTWDDIENGVFAIVRQPGNRRQKLAHYQKELGIGVVLTGCQTGTADASSDAQKHGTAGPRSAAAHAHCLAASLRRADFEVRARLRLAAKRGERLMFDALKKLNTAPASFSPKAAVSPKPSTSPGVPRS